MAYAEPPKPIKDEYGEGTLEPVSTELKLREISLRSRGRSRNIYAKFLESYMTYSSIAELSLEFRLPKLVACFKTKLKLFFDQDVYNSKDIDVSAFDFAG